MQAISTNQISDILSFNVKGVYHELENQPVT